MSEVLLLPEMLSAGIEALIEARERGLGDDDLCIQVFLAMRAIEEIAVLRHESKVVH